MLTHLENIRQNRNSQSAGNLRNDAKTAGSELPAADQSKTENSAAEASDELTLLYTAIYSNPELANILCDNLPYIEPDKAADAIYYTAMGMRHELLDLVQHKPKSRFFQ